MHSSYQVKKLNLKKVVIYRYLEILIKKQVKKLHFSRLKVQISFLIKYILCYIYITIGKDPISVILFAISNTSPKYESISVKSGKKTINIYKDNSKYTDLYLVNISPKRRVFLSIKLLSEAALFKSKKRYSSFSIYLSKEIIDAFKASPFSSAVLKRKLIETNVNKKNY